jgi:hypothetical protein
MVVWLGAVFFVIVSVFCSSLVRKYWVWKLIFHTVAVTDVLSRIIKFAVTGFPTQSLYCPQVIHIINVKLLLHLFIFLLGFLFRDWVCRCGVCGQNKRRKEECK